MSPILAPSALALFALAINLGGCRAAKEGADAPASAKEAPSPSAQKTVAVEVTAEGYEPSTVEAREGEPLTLVFKRTTEQGCGQEVVFPDYDIRRDLPLGEDVPIDLTPKAGEQITFTCGMGMYRGSIVGR